MMTNLIILLLIIILLNWLLLKGSRKIINDLFFILCSVSFKLLYIDYVDLKMINGNSLYSWIGWISLLLSILLLIYDVYQQYKI